MTCPNLTGFPELFTLPFLFVHDLGVNNGAFVLAAAFGLRAGFRAGRGAGTGLAFAGAGLVSGGLVKFGADGLPDFVEFLGGGLDGRAVGAFEGFLHSSDGGINFALVVGGNLVLVVLQHFFRAIDEVVGLVAGLDLFLLEAVVLGMGLGVLAHRLDLVLGEAAAGGDGDFLLLAGAKVLGAVMEDAVGVDIKGDFDLGHTARGGRNIGEMKLADGLVVLGELAFTLEDVDFDTGLVVRRGGKNFRLAGRDGGVALDQLGEHTAEGLDAERERGDIEQQHVLDLALEHAALDAGADGDDFIRVDTLMRGLIDERVGGLDHAGHAGHAADEHEFIDLIGRDASVFQTGLNGPDGALEQIITKLLHFGASELHADVFGAAGVRGDKGKIDFVLRGAGEGDLGLLGFLLDALEGVGLLAEVHALLAFEFVENPVDDFVVPIVTTEVGVAIGGLHLEDTVADFQDGDVERSTAEVVDGNFFVFFLVETIGEGRSGGLVDDAEDFEPGDAAGVLGGLALGVVEISWHGDDGLGDFFTEARFSIGFELGQDHGRNFRRGELLGFAVHFHFDGGVAIGGADDFVGDALDFLLHFIELAAHEALDGIHSIAGVGDGLAFGGVADDAFTGFGESNDGRSGAFALGIFENLGLAAFHDRHTRVGRP